MSVHKISKVKNRPATGTETITHRHHGALLSCCSASSRDLECHQEDGKLRGDCRGAVLSRVSLASVNK
jgi:hypothetical protein